MGATVDQITWVEQSLGWGFRNGLTGGSYTSGTPEQLIVLSRATYLPLYTALATAAAVLAMLLQFYLLALAAALVTAGLFVLAGQGAGLARDYGPMPVGRGVSVPPHTEVAGAPPWLALNFTLVADGTLFTSLLFGTLYLWISAPNWPPAAAPEPDLMLVLLPSRPSPAPRRRRADRCDHSPLAARRASGSASPYSGSSSPLPRLRG